MDFAEKIIFMVQGEVDVDYEIDRYEENGKIIYDIYFTKGKKGTKIRLTSNGKMVDNEDIDINRIVGYVVNTLKGE